MAARSAFSWGVSTSGAATEIPSVNNVYQWYAYVKNYGTDDNPNLRINLNVLYRAFRATSKSSGPFYAEDQWTVEAMIRRSLNVAAQLKLEKAAHQYNQRMKLLFERMIKEREGKNSEKFRELFESIVEQGDDATIRGMALFEPFATEVHDPPLVIEGNTFPNQGAVGAKRLRLMTETDDGMLVPVRFIPDDKERMGGIRLAHGGRPWPNPRGDVRLLAGSLAIGNPDLYHLLFEFLNMLMVPVRFTTTKNANLGGAFFVTTGQATLTSSAVATAADRMFPVPTTAADECETIPEGRWATFPTIFTREDVEEIQSMIVTNFTDQRRAPMAYLPFYGDRVVRFINDRIKQRLAQVTSAVEIEPMKLAFELDRRTVADIAENNRNAAGGNMNHHTHHMLVRGHEAANGQAPANTWNVGGGAGGPAPGYYTKEQKDIHREHYDAMQNKLNELRTNPVLWINGPRLNPDQGAAVMQGRWIDRRAHIQSTKIVNERFRESILPGWSLKDLHSYCHDAGPGVADAYTLERQPGSSGGQIAQHFFTTDSTDNSRLGSLLDGNDRPPGRKGQGGGFNTDRDYITAVAPGQDNYRRKSTFGTDEPNAVGAADSRHNQFYKNYADPMTNMMDTLNTIYNIMSTPGVAVRLKDWQNALGISDEIEGLPEEADDSDNPSVIEDSFSERVLAPEAESRFRVSMMRLPQDAEVREEGIDFDESFKQFEYDHDVGDMDSYINEIQTVIRLALESILIESGQVGVGHTDRTLFEVYDDRNFPIDRVIPVVPVPVVGPLDDGIRDRYNVGVINRHAFGRIPRTFRRGEEYRMSACSHFVYNNVVSHATAPFTESGRKLGDVKKVAALLASLNPFPTDDPLTRQFIAAVLERCHERLRAMFEGNMFHLVQHLEPVRQPFPPITVKFERTRSPAGRLRWMVGSESTWVLEGIVLAVNLINRLAGNGDNGAAVGGEKVDDDMIPPMPLDFDKPSTEARAGALQRTQVSRKSALATQSLARHKIMEARNYSRWLHLSAAHTYNQAGRYFFGTPRTASDRGPVGLFRPLSNKAIPCSSYSGRLTRSAQNVANKRLRLSLVDWAIGAATTNEIYTVLRPGGFDLNDYRNRLSEAGANATYTNGTLDLTADSQDVRMVRQLAVIGMGAGLIYYVQYSGVAIANINNVGNPSIFAGQPSIRLFQYYRNALAIALRRLQGEYRRDGTDRVPTTYQGIATRLREKFPWWNITREMSLDLFKEIVTEAIYAMVELENLRTTSPIVYTLGVDNVAPLYGIEVVGDEHRCAFPVENDDDAPTLFDLDPDNYFVALNQQLARMDGGEYTFDMDTGGTTNVGGIEVKNNQRFAIPLWKAKDNDSFEVDTAQATESVVGYLYLSKSKMVCNRVPNAANGRDARTRFNFYQCAIDRVAVFQDEAIHRVGTFNAKEIYAFRYDVVAGIPTLEGAPDNTIAQLQEATITTLLRLYKDVPMFYATAGESTVMEQTSRLVIETSDEVLPYRFTAVQNPRPRDGHEFDEDQDGDNFGDSDIGVDEVVNELMGAFNGLHFSNSHSLHRTVLAVAVNELGDQIQRFLNQPLVGRYKSPVNWTVKDGDDSGDSVLLVSLHQFYEQSTTRATDTPMADRVIVRVQGPGHADLSTTCWVEGYYYRTSMFFSIEVKAMALFKSIVTQTVAPPPGSVSRPIASQLSRVDSIHGILRFRKTAASAIAKLMYTLYQAETVAQRTTANRNRNSLTVQSATLQVDAKHILYGI